MILKLGSGTMILKLWDHDPEAVLRIIDCDEKPLWYTNAANKKILAVRGSAQVPVKMNVAATRTRFTEITRMTVH